LPARARQALTAIARFALRSQYRGEVLHDWRRRRNGEPRLPDPSPRRILVLCHGNICRSPFAEALLRARCAGRLVRSAGFAAGESVPADPTAIAVAREWSIDLEPHRAHLLRDADLDWAQLVLVMTGAQARELAERGSAGRAAQVRLLGDYLPAPPFAIDDPYGQSMGAFRTCFRRIDAATARLSALLAEHEA
jgi:protein-tyrosine phosphatase